MMRSFYILILLLCVLCGISQPKGEFSRKKEITYDGKRYSVFNNYLTIGAGTEYNTYTEGTQLNLGGDFNFHIQAIYFQTGIFLAGDRFGNWNHAQLHLAIGKRFEMKKFNMAGYLGGSAATINRPFFDSTYNEYRSRTLKPLGLHATVQFTYKFKYDVGIGVALFSDINKYQSVYGIRLELYFSSAFLGYRRGENENSILHED
ncbi:MAG: hypothetical protein K0S33_886 [Bacteroidetes bacterium]|jgi:hypothetical protein|nr:hypothetical protein [Bacteroidota bacterium]